MNLVTAPLPPATPFAPAAADGPAFGPLTPSLQRWLSRFAAAVRAKDFAAGEVLCDAAAVSFGTVCARADSLAELVERQWSQVWPRTAGFDFDYATAVAAVADELAVVLSTWSSVGFDRNGQPFRRTGRSTIAVRGGADQWRAVHTHFSMTPGA